MSADSLVDGIKIGDIVEFVKVYPASPFWPACNVRGTATVIKIHIDNELGANQINTRFYVSVGGEGDGSELSVVRSEITRINNGTVSVQESGPQINHGLDA
jgi:hypothetical protein